MILNEETKSHRPPDDQPPEPARCIWSQTGCLVFSADTIKGGGGLTLAK